MSPCAGPSCGLLILSIQIFYTSRTHTQLRQLTSELLKTTFAHIPDQEESEPLVAIGAKSEDLEVTVENAPTRMVPLASRRQMCINEKVSTSRAISVCS